MLRAPREVEAEFGASLLPLAELLAMADVVSVHTPLTPATRGLFGAGEFARVAA